MSEVRDLLKKHCKHCKGMEYELLHCEECDISQALAKIDEPVKPAGDFTKGFTIAEFEEIMDTHTILPNGQVVLKSEAEKQSGKPKIYTIKEILDLSTKPPEPADEKCEWKLQKTKVKDAYTIMAGCIKITFPRWHGFNFCPFCSKEISEKKA